jgi:hypothetical protein
VPPAEPGEALPETRNKPAGALNIIEHVALFEVNDVPHTLLLATCHMLLTACCNLCLLTTCDTLLASHCLLYALVLQIRHVPNSQELNDVTYTLLFATHAFRQASFQAVRS